MKHVRFLLVLATLVSCATSAPEIDDAPASQSESRQGRSVEWLKEHCPDCLGRGPKARP